MRCLSTIILATFLVIGSSADVVSTIKEKFAKIPSEFNNLMPDEISEYIQSLTPEEGISYELAAKKYKEFKNSEDYADFIKKQNPELYEKAAKLQETWKGKLADLSDDAKEFVQNAYSEALKIHSRYISDELPSIDELKEIGKVQLEKYIKLSKEAKDSIASHFPTFHEMLIKAKDALLEAKDVVYGTIKDEI